MKIIAIATLVALTLFVAGDVVTGVEIVGTASATTCTYHVDEFTVNPCAPVCRVGEQLGWHCIA